MPTSAPFHVVPNAAKNRPTTGALPTRDILVATKGRAGDGFVIVAAKNRSTTGALPISDAFVATTVRLSD